MFTHSKTHKVTSSITLMQQEDVDLVKAHTVQRWQIAPALNYLIRKEYTQILKCGFWTLLNKTSFLKFIYIYIIRSSLSEYEHDFLYCKLRKLLNSEWKNKMNSFSYENGKFPNQLTDILKVIIIIIIPLRHNPLRAKACEATESLTYNVKKKSSMLIMISNF